MRNVVVGLFIFFGPAVVLAGGKDAVRRVVRKNMKDVKVCYETMLQRRDLVGERSGKVVIGWEVDSEGKAQNPVVKDEKTTLKNAELHSCIIEKLKSWEFPKPPEGKTIAIKAYPFEFKEDASQ